METKIVNQSAPLSDIVEESLFSDISGNHWKIQVCLDSMYLLYLGADLDRKSDFQVTSDDGFTLLVEHDNVFQFNNSEMNTYFHLRDIVKGSITSMIWEFIQRQLAKHNNKRIKLNRH